MWLKRGFTLFELLMALVVTGLAAGLIMRTLVAQQRFYSSASAVLDARAQIRDAAEILATDIRNASATSPPFLVMSDSAVEMFTTIAASIVCATLSPQAVGLPPSSLTSGAILTSVLAQPDTGDVALIHTYPAGRPDLGQWESFGIASAMQRSASTTCPAGSGFSSGMAGASNGIQITLASPPANAIVAGAPVRFLRRARYSLYRSSDSRWYLGYRRCNSSGCAGIQPVSGPYDPYSPSAAGLQFRYFDSAGTRLTAGGASSVARVDIVIRGKSARRGSLAGDSRSTYSDSTVVSVSPRNRLR